MVFGLFFFFFGVKKKNVSNNNKKKEMNYPGSSISCGTVPPAPISASLDASAIFRS